MTDQEQRNIKLTVAYDGTNYAGWQRQKTDPTIQASIENAIHTMTGSKVVLHGAGRTDAGVHAYGMTANFNTDSKIPLEGFRKGLNSLLPYDIRMLQAEEVVLEFHARYFALGKVYLYHLRCNGEEIPTERLYCHHVSHDLNVQAMQECLFLLLGEHDFSSFEAAGSRDMEADNSRGAVRVINTARVFKPEPEDSGRMVIEISGDGFLRHMVRNIVGTVIEAGAGKRSVADFRNLIEARDRSLAGPTAPARGLFLKKIFY